MTYKEPLKPCPGCGDDVSRNAVSFYPESRLFSVGCVASGCLWQGPRRCTEAEADEAWNRRSPEVAAQAENAALKEKIGEAVDVIGYLKAQLIAFASPGHKKEQLHGVIEADRILARLTEPAQEKPRCEACYRGPYDLPHTCGAQEKKP